MLIRVSTGFLAAGLSFIGSVVIAQTPPTSGPATYKDRNAPLEDRVKDAVARMTMAEKIKLVSGDISGFATSAIPRLGIPSIGMSDGPVGVRWDQSTAFPVGIALAATFNPSLAATEAKAMAEETKAHGRDMLLGPCIDIARQPFGGRNFESFGEDPFLTSQITAAYVRGLQGQGVLASTKHYALNDQEFKRMEIDVVADERTMQEIHLPAFHAAVDAGTWTVMAAYNKVNGKYASENGDLLNKILKTDWGFKGFVVSDWGATHSTIAAANNGLDLEMPHGIFFGAPLGVAVSLGQVSEATMNDKAARIIRAMIGSGLFDEDKSKRPKSSTIGGPEHLQVAEQVGAESIVLLKNSTAAGTPVLPLNNRNLHRIAVIGPSARFARTGGGGSSMVTPTRVVNPIDALRERLPNTDIQYAVGVAMEGDFEAVGESYWSVDGNPSHQGVRAEYFANQDLQGAPAVTRTEHSIDFDWNGGSPDAKIPTDHFSARWTGYLIPPSSGDIDFAVRSDDGVRVWIDDTLVVNSWGNHATSVENFRKTLVAGHAYKFKMEYFENLGAAVAGFGFTPKAATDLKEAIDLASRSDVAIVFAGLSSNFESEGADRKTMDLPAGQDDLIQKVIAANPNTVVVIGAGNPVGMPWASSAKALLYSWYLGQEGGYAITDVLLGTVNPSGKLPVSIPKRWEDSSAYGAYPEDAKGSNRVVYKEGIYVGYRHFDKHGVEPLFPFGFGLSYTTFSYGAPSVTVVDSSAQHPQVTVDFDLTNSGAVAGSEVAQVYVSEPGAAVDRPVQELKGFKKLMLQPGETKHVTVPLDSSAFAYWDVKKHGWTVDANRFEIRVGSSSRDIRGRASVQLH